MTVIKADRAAWKSARTLADLGELTAQWIEGAISSQPGYHGPSDIEDPVMVPVLAALNRAGFVTNCSQAALDEDGWQQRAAVEGFITDARLLVRISDAAFLAGLIVVVHSGRLPRWRYGHRKVHVVTRHHGRAYTLFGVHLPRRHIRDGWIGYGVCHPNAVGALCAARQVTVIDPEWGRDELLWRVLERTVNT